MSDRQGHATPLASSGTTTLERVSGVVAGLGVVAVALTATTWLRETTEAQSFAGVAFFDWLAVLSAAVGLGVVALGVGSRVGAFETTPDERAGTLTGVGFGLIAFVAGGLVVSQTLGFGATWQWGGAALLSAFVVGGAIVVAPEDLGTAIPVGILGVGVAGLIAGGVIDAAWTWSPEGFDVTFPGFLVAPGLVGITGLVGAWASARAYDGFGSRGRQTGAFVLIGLCASLMLAILAILITFIVQQGFDPATRGFEVGIGPATIPILSDLYPFADEVYVPFIDVDWPFVENGYSFRPDVITGVFPAVVGTFYVVAGAVVLGVPLAVAAAVFLTEYAEQGRFVQVVEVATNGLWSTPSVVFGLFGYAFLVPRLGNQTSLLAGMITLGFMLIPLVLITSREAILAVPDEYRDASAALGVSQWETIKSVVLPAAMPGVMTGVILGVGRIAGETAPILLVMAGGLRDPAPDVLGSFQFSASPPFVTNPELLQAAPNLPYQLYAAITAGVTGENAQAFGWATAFVLLLVVLSFYAVGIGMRIYFRRQLQQ